MKKRVKNMKKAIFLIMSILLSLTMAGCKKEESFVDTMAQGVNDFVDQAIVGEEGKVFTITESSLQEILEISELSTFEYTYNSIAKVPDANGKLQYSVYYSGKVTAGIDFNDVKLTIDDKNKIVNIKVPDASFQSIVIDDGSLDFIFVNDKDDNIKIHKEAVVKADADLCAKVNDHSEIKELAKENAKAIVENLLKPWIEYAGYSYTIE